MATGLGTIFGDSPESDLVPAVEPPDIRSVWTMQKEFQSLFPGEGLVISADAYKQACRPGADVRAVFERTSMLGLLQTAEILKPDDAIDDALLQVLATIPMKRMQVGVVHEGFPFDAEEFLRQVNQSRDQGD